MMKRTLLSLFVIFSGAVSAQIRVSPVAVNVNAQGASTVFLSYGTIRPDQFSAEALWCGDIVPAAPDIGFKCDPGSTWGRLPLRNDLTRPSGSGGLTDIMTIPQNVIRRAYESAAKGAVSSFYYVRRFSSSAGKPDEYIPIVCRLTGPGAKVPLALTGVKLRFSSDKLVLSTPVGEPPPPLFAELTYTGTGRLIGRWEIVMPGEDPPAPLDLVPEASLPVEQRVAQKRYTQLSHFNVQLPPVGRFRLEGPDVSKLPTGIEGLYQVLLRIEASSDLDGNTDLSDVGPGSGVVTSGGVAGFAIPPLRYYAGSPGSAQTLALVEPVTNAILPGGGPVDFAWRGPSSAFYRVDLQNSEGTQVLSAIIEAPAMKYRSPPLVGDLASNGKLTWTVTALDADGKELAHSPRWTFQYGETNDAQ
jgi:hypothetical protein